MYQPDVTLAPNLTAMDRMFERLSYSTIWCVLSFVDTHRELGVCAQTSRGWRDAANILITRRYATESNQVDAVLSLILNWSEHAKSLTTVPLESWTFGWVSGSAPDARFDDERIQQLATVSAFPRVKSREWLARYGLVKCVPFCDVIPCTERLILCAMEPIRTIDRKTCPTFVHVQYLWQDDAVAIESEQPWTRRRFANGVHDWTFGRIERGQIVFKTVGDEPRAPEPHQVHVASRVPRPPPPGFQRHIRRIRSCSDRCSLRPRKRAHRRNKSHYTVASRPPRPQPAGFVRHVRRIRSCSVKGPAHQPCSDACAPDVLNGLRTTSVVPCTKSRGQCGETHSRRAASFQHTTSATIW